MNKSSNSTRCQYILPKTKQQCKKKSVLPNTFRTVSEKDEHGKRKTIRTSIVNNENYCQMHQPDKPKKCHCSCHEEPLFGKFGKKNKSNK